MRHSSNASKQNLRSIVSQKHSLIKLQSKAQYQPVSKTMLLTSHTASISNIHSKPQTSKGILHKFIENGSRYDTNSRRQSLESKVSRISIGSLNKFMEDTTNYSDEIKTLKNQNRQLMEENKELKRIVDQNNKMRLSNASSQRSLNYNSFDFINLLEDSNNILKKKFEQGKKATTLGPERDKSLENRGSYAYSQIDSLCSKIFEQRVFPQVQPLIELIQKFIKQHDQFFIKIEVLAKRVQCSSSQNLKQLSRLVSTLKHSIFLRNGGGETSSKKLMQKSPRDDRLKSKTKSSRKQDTSMMDLFAPEMLSPEDTLRMLERLLEKITRSESMLDSLHDNPSLCRLIRRVL